VPDLAGSCQPAIVLAAPVAAGTPNAIGLLNLVTRHFEATGDKGCAIPVLQIKGMFASSRSIHHQRQWANSRTTDKFFQPHVQILLKAR
jgi:hypothetical protein